MFDMNRKTYLLETGKNVYYDGNIHRGSVNLVEEVFNVDFTGASSNFPDQFRWLSQLIFLSFVDNLVYVVTLMMTVSVGARFLYKYSSESHRLGVISVEDFESFRDNMDFKLLFQMLVISSLGKVYIILTIIWDYNWAFSHLLSGIVMRSNMLAVYYFLQRYCQVQRHMSSNPKECPRKASIDISRQRVAFVILIAIATRFCCQLVMYYLGYPVLFWTLL